MRTRRCRFEVGLRPLNERRKKQFKSLNWVEFRNLTDQIPFFNHLVSQKLTCSKQFFNIFAFFSIECPKKASEGHQKQHYCPKSA